MISIQKNQGTDYLDRSSLRELHLYRDDDGIIRKQILAGDLFEIIPEDRRTKSWLFGITPDGTEKPPVSKLLSICGSFQLTWLKTTILSSAISSIVHGMPPTP